MSSPVITLILLVLGLAGGVLLVGSFVGGEWRAGQRWTVAALLVVVVALGVGLPGKLRGNGQALDDQRAAYAGTSEQMARERCLHDMGRPDLVETLAFAREQIPEGGSFFAVTRSQSVGCVMLNLLPRRPVRQGHFDSARDWIVLDGIEPERLSRRAPALREHAMAEGRHVPYGASFVLVRPEAAGE